MTIPEYLHLALLVCLPLVEKRCTKDRMQHLEIISVNIEDIIVCGWFVFK